MTTDTIPARNVAISNSLADLATRINAEHRAVAGALKSALAHAIAAGELLWQAREQLPHGEWLPWLKANCSIPERTVRHYLRLTKSREALTDENGNVADLTVREAVKLIARTVDEADGPHESALGSSEWAEAQLEGPFDDWDFEIGGLDWIRTKLLHHAKVPTHVAWGVALGDGSTLGLRFAASLDDLVEALQILFPIAKSERHLPLHLVNHNPMHAALDIKFAAMGLVAVVYDEIQHRKKISDERYERERKDACRTLMAWIDEKRRSLTRDLTADSGDAP
jgi:hypothetical protein